MAESVVERDAVGDVRFVLGVENCRGEETKIARRSRYVERPRERERLTGINRFRAREFFQIALNQFRDAKEDA